MKTQHDEQTTKPARTIYCINCNKCMDRDNDTLYSFYGKFACEGCAREYYAHEGGLCEDKQDIENELMERKKEADYRLHRRAKGIAPTNKRQEGFL